MTSKKKTKVSDGWHTIKGNTLYVENGRVRRAVAYDHNGSKVPAQLYYWSDKNRAWMNAQGTLFSTACSGIYRGTYRVL